MSNEGFNKVSLSNIGNGAAVELFDSVLPDIYANLLDPETDPKKVRSLTLEVRFKRSPHNPVIIDYDISIKKKIAIRGYSNGFEIGMDEGEITGWESEGIQQPLPGIQLVK